ncbi:ABC transporter substrate-binding protein [Nocardioides aequoreus]|uniref:ABC transporter substrate-binding protein n=1 Tax=Nocardioides aequoreus TaxID=397278 RepID=UPI0012F69342|nr:hypothetical protein [Nocardioides aequoreus]
MTSDVTHATPGTTVRVGSFTPSVLLALAQRNGALDRVRLRVHERPVPSSPAQFASLRDGELDVALTSPDNVLAYRFAPRNPLGERLDATIVGALDRGTGLALYGRPGLTGPEQLRGATLGVDVPTSGFALAMYAVAEHLGVPRDAYDLTALGSTPKRLQALLRGDCDATMLNAGNQLPAEAAGCVRLGSAAEVCAPYLGTVVAVVGERHLDAARRLTAALTETAASLLDGHLDGEAVEEAQRVLGLPADLAARYVAGLRDPDEGLVTGPVDRAALATLVDLRRRYLPEPDGSDPLARALERGSGLLDDEPAA